MKYDVIIVGGGIAGLTAAAFTIKQGKKVLLCEKEKHIGGLIGSFNYKGFTFDAGIRSIEDSGIVMPMLKSLDIEIDFLKSIVSLGIEKDIIKVKNKDALNDYEKLLISKFPENVKDIKNIIKDIKRIMKYMDILYGIDNPVFLDIKKDRKYFITKIFPWVFKYLFTAPKIKKLYIPVEEYLLKMTSNQALIDMIAQHFFKKTPTFFALSYFSLYLDYQYPKGGTGVLVDKLKDYFTENQGLIETETEIVYIDPNDKMLRTKGGKEYKYDKLIWAGDLKRFYELVDYKQIKEEKVKEAALDRKEYLKNKVGGDSVLTMYLTVDIDKNYFSNISTGHFFYTPKIVGLNKLMTQQGEVMKSLDKDKIFNWVKDYYDLTTYEISLPVLRDKTLAPENKTGLIISTLMDYDLVEKIDSQGWLEEFVELSKEAIINALENSIYPGIKSKKLDSFIYTPLTIKKKTFNSDGAITGWAFTNDTIPSVNKISHIKKSVITPFKDIYQAGQWTYSPSGLPISILTGKLAADVVNK